LQILEFLIKSLAKLIDSGFPFHPIALKLVFMNSVPELVLPDSNLPLESSDLIHELLKLNILLKMQAIIRNKF